MAQDDYLNIWVIAHDKASEVLDKLAKNLRNADAGINKLENSLGKLDNRQVRSMQNQLDMGKVLQRVAQGTDKYTKAINEMAKARQKDAEEARKAQSEYEKIHTRALAENDAWNKRMAAQDEKAAREAERNVQRATKRLEAIKEKSRRAEEARELAHQRVLGRHMGQYYDDREAAHREDLERTEKAAADLRSQEEKAEKEREAKLLAHQKILGRHWAKYYDDLFDAHREHAQRMKQAEQDNDKFGESTNRLGRGLQRLSEHFQKNDQFSNRFYLRILGLRLSVLGLVATFPPLIGGLVQIAGLLTAVGSAAAVAAGALGGALVAGITQSLPVLGLLIGAFTQLAKIIKLTSDAQKLAEEAADQQGDKSLQLRRRLEQERLAQQQLAEAQRRLVDARKEALRNIQDLNQAEKEAFLNSQRATLGLIGSTDALQRLVSTGGSALEVAGAQLDVSDARNGVASSGVALGRARNAASTARRQGVNNNPNVVAAQQALVNQRREMALAAAEFAAQQNNVTAATSKFNRELEKLNPAQRRLYDAIVDLRKEFKEEWSGITDPIIDSFTRVVKGITKALKDKDIQDAFKGLSGATGQAIDTATSFFGTPEAKKLFLQVLKDARTNLPIIARTLNDITKIWLRIAVAAGPFVTRILKGIEGFFDRFEQKTRNKKSLDEFFKTGERAAKAFWDILTGVVNIFVTLGQNGGVKTGIGILESVARYLGNINRELKGNKGGLEEFFGRVGETADRLGSILDQILRGFVRIERTGVFESILQVIDEMLLPALLDVLEFTGKILKALLDFAIAHPDLVKTSAIIAGIFLVAFKLFGLFLKLQAALVILAPTMAGAFAPFLVTIGIVIAALAGLAIAIYLLDKKFHFLAPTFKWLKKIFFETIEYISKHWKGLGRIILLISGPIGWATLLIIENFGKIKKHAIDLKNKLDPVFDFIVKWVIEPLWKVVKKVFDIFTDIVEFFDEHSASDLGGEAFGAVASIVESVVDWLEKMVGKLGRVYDLAVKIKDLLPGKGPSGIDLVTGSSGAEAVKAAARGAPPASAAVSNPVLQAALGRNPLRQGGGGANGQGFITSTGGIVPGSASGRLAGSNSGQEDVSPSTAAGDPGKAASLAQRAQAIADIMDNMPRTDSRGQKIRGYPYAWGGGHGALGKPSRGRNKVTGAQEVGFDCSGAVSAVLGAIGALSSPLDSNGFMGWGVPARGDEPIVVWTKPGVEKGHAFIVINGVTYTTGAGEDSGFGRGSHGTAGFTARTIPGFADGGWVPGEGTGDTVPAWLTPGELVLNKAHQAMLGGASFLKKVLKFAPGGPVPKPTVMSGGGRDNSIPNARIAATAYLNLVKAFTALDRYFDDMAKKVTQLVQKQRSKIINARYLVGGSGRNTTVIDTGSDLQDAERARGDLGVQRGLINQELLAAHNAASDATQQLKNKKLDKKTRTQLKAAEERYQNKVRELQEALDQNTIDLFNAQAAVLQAAADNITNYYNKVINSANLSISVANFTGVGKENIPNLIQIQINAMADQKTNLINLMNQAAAQGNAALVSQFQDQIMALDQSIMDGLQSKFQAMLDAGDVSTNRKLMVNDINTRLSNLGGNSFRSLQQQGGLLQDRNQALREMIQYLNAVGADPSLTLAQRQELNDRVLELNTQIAENSDAIRSNSEAIKQAQVDRINSLGAFRGGINSGAQGLMEALAELNGIGNPAGVIQSLTNQGNNLRETGSGLRGLLSSQFGINLSSDPENLLSQLLNTDFGAMTFGMDDDEKSRFEDLINSIIENTTAQVNNTVELKKANDDMMIQDWTSSLWQNFRDALFTGNGGILGGIPQAATGAHVLSAGLIRVHAGETIQPAGVSRYSSANSAMDIDINIDNRGEGDVDTLALTKRLGFELSTRGR